MKKKKFFSYMLLGLLAVGATGTVTSCKDYDDDINGLQTQVTSLNEALAKQKSDLEAEIATLKNDLTAADARLEGLVQTAQNAANAAQQAANKAQGTADDALSKATANASSIADEIVRAKAAELALQTRLDVAESTLTSLQGQIDKLNANKLDKTEFADSIVKIYGRLEAVETGLGGALTRIGAIEGRLTTAEGNIVDLQRGLADEVLAREAVAADLAQQKEALGRLKDQLENTTSDLNTKISNLKNTVEGYNTALNTKIDNLKTDLEAKIADAQRTLQNQITALGERVTTNEGDIATLKGNVNDIYTKISQLQNEINILNVFCTGQLRSLVFIPSAYYYGIEATEVFTLNYWQYTDFKGANWVLANADKEEPVGYDKSERYNSIVGSTATDVTASYHMNPGIADEPDTVTIIDADKKAIEPTRASDAFITTKSFKKNNEQLDVKLKFRNPAAIKSIPNDGFVTVFAAQAHYKTADKDTTVTSDYAALYKTTITDVVLAKTNSRVDKNYTGQVNTTATDFKNAHDNLHSTLNDQAKSHLIPSVYDAMAIAHQDELVYNQTLDLSKLVEVHYTDADGAHKTFSSNDLDRYGLGLKYELTASFEGGNATSEAAHAGINGTTFRAQLPKRDGKAYSWDEYNKTNFSDDSLKTSSVGRQPIVRFSLVDKNNNDRVIDYGYIKIKFILPEQSTEYKQNVTVTYVGDPYVYNSDCVPAEYKLTTTWNQIEYDVLQLTGLNKKAFDENYENDGHLVVNGQDVVKQFNVATVNAIKNSDAASAKELNPYIGTVLDNYDAESSETQTFTWTISSSELEKALYGKKSHDPFQIAILYKSKNAKVYPDVYVILRTGAITINTPSGQFLTDNGAEKIREFWYKDNGNGNTELGNAEIHAQTLSPEDPQAKVYAEDFDDTFSDVFVGNNISLANVNDVTTNKDFASGKRLYNFVFSASNVGKKFKGYEANGDGKDGYSVVEWTLGVSADGKTLVATHKNGNKLSQNQVVATIDGTWSNATGIKTQKVSYDGPMNDMSEAANSLLNYVAHNKLADDVLKAIVALKVKTNVCEHELALTNNEFNVRFLRPINAVTNEKELTDAKDSKQVIYIKDLVDFTDWRDYAFADHASYWTYYNIKDIKVVGMTGKGVSDANPSNGLMNNYIYTTMTTTEKAEPNKLDDKVVQSTISNQVRFFNVRGTGIGNDKYGHILYENLSSTVHDFTVRVPLAITYEWGTLYTTVDVKVNATQSNAKARK